MGSEQRQLDAAPLEQAPQVQRPQLKAMPSVAGQTPAPSISLEAEVPELLYDGMRQYLSNHPEWDQYRLVTSALANFLFQNGCADQCVTQHFLNGLFLRPYGQKKAEAPTPAHVLPCPTLWKGRLGIVRSWDRSKCCDRHQIWAR